MSKFCISCGAINADNSTMCTRCGKSFGLLNVLSEQKQLTDEYMLQPGTVLEGRYRIRCVIGEGGFGITYEAVNEKIDMTVAIKEFYCREYIRRNVAESDCIQITYAATAEVFKKAKNRFFQEAKILSEFSNENAIVRILDCFEANGTVYIVMDYLHGTSLDKYLKQNGPMEWEDVLKKFKPLLSTLENVHNRGIIHRDISTSNIMVLENESLCLLDFGAAKDILKSEKRATSVVFTKQGYTPIEQYAEQYAQNENVGSWSDVYALSAVCYECLTGECPPDSLQRMILDEYKTLKEQGRDVPVALESVIKKGLAVQVKDRYANVGELLAAMDQISKKKKAKWSKKLVLVFFIIAILFGAGGIWFYQSYKEEIFFHFKDTENFCLTWDKDISLDELNKNLKKIKKRIQVFVGDQPYILEKQDDSIRGVLPLECFGKEDPIEIIRNLIARPNKWTINGVKIEQKYIADINYKDDNKEKLTVNLTENTPKEVQETLASLCKNKDATLSVDSEYNEHLSIKGKMNSTLSYTLNVQEQWGETNIKDLFLYNISHDELTVRFKDYAQIQTIWEKRDSDTAFGKKQCDVDELGENTVTLEYYRNYGEDLTEGEVIDSIAKLKQKMDILEIPYALGRDKYHNQRLVLCVNQKEYNKDLFFLLLKDYNDLRIQDARGRTIVEGIYLENLAVEKDTSGIHTVSVCVDHDLTKKILKITKEMIERGTTEYYVTVNNIRLLGGNLKKKSSKSVPIKDGVFHFNSINMDNQEIGNEHDRIMNLLNYLLSKKELDSGYKMLTYQYSNGEEIVSAKPKEEHKELRFDKSKEDNIIKSLKKLSEDYEINSYFDYDDGDIDLFIILPNDIYLEYIINAEIINQISQIMDICGIQDGTSWTTIVIGMLSSKEENTYEGKILFYHSYDFDNLSKYKYPYSISVIGYDEDKTKWIKNIYQKMKSDNRFRGYKIEFHDYSNYYTY